MPAHPARLMWNWSRMVAVVRDSANRARQELDRAERDGDSSVDELVGLGQLTARLQGCAEEADAAMAELWRIADVLSPGVREPTPEGVCIVHDLGPAPYVAGQLEEAWKERAGPVRTAIGLIQELDEMRPARSGET